MSENDFLKMVEGATKAGASGCLVGRNFSEAKSIEKIVRAASMIIKENKSLNESMKVLI